MEMLKGILKKGIAIGLALTIVGSAGAQAVGTAVQIGQEPAQESTQALEQQPAQNQVVLKSLYQDTTQEFWPYVDQVVVLEKYGSLKTDALPKKQQYLDTKDGKHELELKWDTASMKLKEAGFHEAEAAPVLTKDQALAEGYDGKVTWPVFRKGTKAVLEVKALQQHGLKDILIAKDSKDPESEVSFTTTDLRYSAGKTGYILSTDEWKWEWDLSKVDTSVTGKATVTGTLKDQPDWIKVAESDKTVEHTVYVMPDDGIYLYAPTGLTEEGKLTFQWIYDSEKVTKAVLEMEKDGKWEACDQSWYTYQMPTEEKTDKDGTKTEALPAALILDLTKIPAKETYTFRLNYVDETSGEAKDRTTEALYITIPENLKELLEKADGKIPAELKLNEKPAPEVKPEPEPEPETKPETEIPADIVTDTYTTLSGKSLAEKIAKGDTVSFEKKGVTLEIPSKLLADLKLKDTDLLTVSLTLPKSGTVQVVVNAGGKVITDLKGSVVKMTYSLAKNKTLTCKDLTGKLSPKVTYTAATKTASFPINQAGTYTLTAKTVSTTSTTTKKPTTTTNKTTSTNKTTTTKKYNTVNKTTTTNPAAGMKPGSGTAVKTSGSAVSANTYEEDTFFLEEDTYEEEPFFFEEETGEDSLFLEEMEEEDAPRTMWDEQTPVALALIAVVGMLLAAGLLLRKWFSE